MTKQRKPAAPPKSKAASAIDKMVQDCVKKAQARKRSGETDRQWREDYAKTLKVDKGAIPMSETPFDGDTNKKK